MQGLFYIHGLHRSGPVERRKGLWISEGPHSFSHRRFILIILFVFVFPTIFSLFRNLSLSKQSLFRLANVLLETLFIFGNINNLNMQEENCVGFEKYRVSMSHNKRKKLLAPGNLLQSPPPPVSKNNPKAIYRSNSGLDVGFDFVDTNSNWLLLIWDLIFGCPQ